MGQAIAVACALFVGDGQDGGTMNVVHITSAQSPYSAGANQTVVVDASAGAVVITAPTLGVGQYLQVEQDSNTTFANTITVNWPGANNGDQPVPSTGTFVASFVFGPGTTWAPPSALGMGLTWYNGGSAGGYLLE